MQVEAAGDHEPVHQCRVELVNPDIPVSFSTDARTWSIFAIVRVACRTE